jgi:arylsulfatase A-like enzyme
MLMTGKYPHANGILQNCNSRSTPYGIELRESARCWSDILNEKGYTLGYIGKWHLDAPRKPYVKCYNNEGEVAWNEWCPPERRHGFDFWYAYGTYDRHMRPMYWRKDADRAGAHYVDQWGPEHEADLAIAYIKNQDGAYRDADRPFALVVSMNPPHMPYDQLPQKYVDMYNHIDTESLCNRPNIPPKGSRWGDYYRKHIRNYLAMTTGVDGQFGRILKVLQECGLADDTIVVFTSDHGNCLGIHDQISKNNPFEESMRIPLMVRLPGKINPRHDDLLISAPDMYPTLLALLGFASDIPKDVEGTSFARLFQSGRGNRPASQLYMNVPQSRPAWGSRGVRTHRYTLIEERMPNRPSRIVLYDREDDPYQLMNIADQVPDIVEQLRTQELISWLEKTHDPWLSKG